jgi:hypothetical protein
MEFSVLKQRMSGNVGEKSRNTLDFLQFCDHIFHSEEDDFEDTFDETGDASLKEEETGTLEDDMQENGNEKPNELDEEIHVVNMDGRTLGEDDEIGSDDDLMDHRLLEKCVEITELITHSCSSILQRDKKAGIFLLRIVADMASKVFQTNSSEIFWENDMMARLVSLWRTSPWGLEHALDYHHHVVVLDEMFGFQMRTKYLKQLSKKIESDRAEIDQIDESETQETEEDVICTHALCLPALLFLI